MLGEWVLNPAEAERLGSYLPKSVKIVRLIGCGTASTADGRAAITAFTRCGLEAYGTLQKVYTSHFDRDGVRRGVQGPPLIGFFPDGRGPVTIGAPPEPRTFDRLRRGAAWLLAVVLELWLRVVAARRPANQRVAALLHPDGSAMPGLLTAPLLTFEIDSGQRTWTLEILFDFECARLYADDGADEHRHVVYAIRGHGTRGKTPLERYLSRAPSGISVLHRHGEAMDRCARVPSR